MPSPLFAQQLNICSGGCMETGKGDAVAKVGVAKGSDVAMFYKDGYAGPVPGLEDEAGEAAEFILPRVKFNAADNLGIAPDVFFKTGTNEILGSELDVVFLDREYSRVRFPKKYQTDSKPLCMTSSRVKSEAKLVGYVCDLETGRPNENGKPIECGIVYGQPREEACPFAQFKNGDAPQCSINANLRAWVVNQKFPCEITFKGTSFSPIYKMIADFVMQKKPLFGAVVRLTLKKQKAEDKYAVVSVQKLRELGPGDQDELAFFYEKYQQFHAGKVKAVEDTVEVVGDAGQSGKGASDEF